MKTLWRPVSAACPPVPRLLIPLTGHAYGGALDLAIADGRGLRQKRTDRHIALLHCKISQALKAHTTEAIQTAAVSITTPTYQCIIADDRAAFYARPPFPCACQTLVPKLVNTIQSRPMHGDQTASNANWSA